MPAIQRAQHAAHQSPPSAAATNGDMPCDTSLDKPSAAATRTAPQVLAGREVAVVGGGPGGMLCAAHLACLGAAVNVFESRDPEAVGQGQGKQPPAMWSIALGSCAERAIEAAGLSSDFGPQWRFEGAAMHSATGTPRFFGRWSGKDTTRNLTGPRKDKVPLMTWGLVGRGL